MRRLECRLFDRGRVAAPVASPVKQFTFIIAKNFIKKFRNEERKNRDALLKTDAGNVRTKTPLGEECSVIGH